MRVVACALVIFNHLPGYLLFTIPGGSKQFVYMCLTMITRINVSLFFMISGALLFQKDEDFLCVLRKRFARIVVLLLVFVYSGKTAHPFRRNGMLFWTNCMSSYWLL